MGHGRCGGLFRSLSKIRSRRRSSRVESRDQRRCKFTSQEKPWPSVLWLRQPRLSTSESDTTHGRPRPGRGQRTTGPHRVRREKNKLCFGGAALKGSKAAYRIVCLPFGVLAFRVTWLAPFFLFLAASSPAITQKNLLAGPSLSADPPSLSSPPASPHPNSTPPNSPSPSKTPP